MNRTIHKLAVGLTTVALTLAAGGTLAASYPGDVEQDDFWQKKPNDFVFGNHIDTHVQLKMMEKQGEPVSLQGSF
jgi:hypothetical protein